MMNQPNSRAPFVKIMAGPFKGFEGFVTGIDQATKRVQITFSYYGKKQITTTLHVSQVQRLVF